MPVAKKPTNIPSKPPLQKKYLVKQSIPTSIKTPVAKKQAIIPSKAPIKQQTPPLAKSPVIKKPLKKLITSNTLVKKEEIKK